MIEKKYISLKKITSYSCWLVAVLVIAFVSYKLEKPVVIKAMVNFSKLMFFILVASFIGTLFELRSWFKYINVLVKPIVRLARLPDVSGNAMMMALMSSTAAAIMLSENFKSGAINRREMLLSALCNSYPAMVSFSLRIMFPIVVAIGIAGLIYYSILYGIGLIIFLSIIFYARFSTKDHLIIEDELPQLEVLAWKLIVERAISRCWDMGFRFLKIVLPLYLLTIYAVDCGFFEALQREIPQFMQNKLSPQTLSVIGARLGGMFSATGVISELNSQQQISTTEIVCALMFGNILTAPIRSIRTNIPKMMGIYPGWDGLWIVLIIQSLRFIFYLFVALILLAMI